MLTFSTSSPTAIHERPGPASLVLIDAADTNRKTISPLLSFPRAHRHGVEDARYQGSPSLEQFFSFESNRTKTTNSK